MPSVSASSPSTNIQCRKLCSASGKAPLGPRRINDFNSSFGFSVLLEVNPLCGERPSFGKLGTTASLLERVRVCFIGKGIGGIEGAFCVALSLRNCCCRCWEMREGCDWSLRSRPAVRGEAGWRVEVGGKC